jgi:aryl-alcohol dehydrogenase-like predicted oxidoreductase
VTKKTEKVRMEYTSLGKSDLSVSRLGFGCCPMGGHGWGQVSENDFEEAVSAALDEGVTFFDTADVYGLGESERLLGKFLGSRRKEAVIATKFGVRTDVTGKAFYDNSPEWIEAALDGSLKRLGTDRIDLYQIHYLDGKTPLADVIGALDKKRREGKIRYYGFSNVLLKDIEDISLPAELVSFQAEYSLAKRALEKDIVGIHERKKIEFLSWGSLGQGVLSGKYGPGSGFSGDDRRSREVYVNFHGEKFRKNLSLTGEMRTMFAGTGKTLTQVAIRWIMDNLGFGVVLTGIKRPSQLIENTGAFGWSLTKEEIGSLDRMSRGL